jgi:hypothetical protein
LYIIKQNSCGSRSKEFKKKRFVLLKKTLKARKFDPFLKVDFAKLFDLFSLRTKNPIT